MHTNENPISDTKEKRRQYHARKSRFSRKNQIRLLLSAAVFSLTLAAGAVWQISNYSAEAPALSMEAPNTTAKQKSAQKNVKKDNTKTQAADTAAPKINDPLTEAEKELALSEQRTDPTSKSDSAGAHITSVSNAWNLTLVNPWNPLPKDHEIQLAMVEGQAIDARCQTQLQNMMTDCRAAGLQPLICSSYRTQEMQEALFQERIDELTAQGYTQKDARKKAATSVAIPGTSEHQLGLAVDIVDKNQQMLDSAQENTLVQKWLMENCWKYGFILRYPNEKSSLTGIIYEPWHYRYVGGRAAKKIHQRGICLEEYLAEQTS